VNSDIFFLAIDLNEFGSSPSVSQLVRIRLHGVLFNQDSFTSLFKIAYYSHAWTCSTMSRYSQVLPLMTSNTKERLSFFLAN
jgi:hypothetical protein